jgi:hypothetical protein
VKKWLIPVVIVVVIAVGVGGFFGGRATGGSSSDGMPAAAGEFSGQIPGDGTVPEGVPSGGTNGSGFSGRDGGSMIAGSIIAADDSSITIQTSDGSTKIVLLSDSTSISKTEEGAQSDLVTGEDVTISGTTNDDGSVTATRIQLGVSLLQGEQGDGPSSGSTTTTAAP